ncbi:ATP-dependent DNA helicase RecG [Corynebacterium sp. sy039]|uniref:ATP-dependent DNA helicase RecG n=1 Tax=Corynebacterium sp. sy039 TaxID=2599641 RepID=UPI0011B6476A|nr:ATP-dependent DNA helicase RecG [Corynebacterium sp. sy039]QDZ42513.1 ATP-dependent DNA helicase RecG [Corynebacterium sp. sy039]
MLGWHDDRKLTTLLPESEAKALAKKFGYHTVEDLLRHYPRQYAAQGADIASGKSTDGDIATLIGTVVRADERYDKNGHLIYSIQIDDGCSRIAATFFRIKWLPTVLPVGVRAMFTGKVKHYQGKPQLQHPDYMVIPERISPADKNHKDGVAKKARGSMRALSHYGDIEDISRVLSSLDFIPIFPAKVGMPTWRILGAIHQVLSVTPPYAEPLQKYAPQDLPSFDTALRGVLEPDKRGAQPYIQRMKYNEALELSLIMALRKHEAHTRRAALMPVHQQGYRQKILDNLPYPLTAGQEKTLEEIAADLAHDTPMMRLLQGEVGSGKTIVSILVMLQALDSGKQSALLAPTEVLAAQHAQSMQKIFADSGVDIHVVVLTSSLSTKEKQQALLDIVSGQAQIIIGTHAILQHNVEFFDLGLSVVDEQHRFGVEQRNYLQAKGKAGTTPHLLVMTATPIPRTIAMTAFGDLELSTLKELPGGRKEIKSFVLQESNFEWMQRAFERMREEMRVGHQVYIVCPRIQGAGGVEEIYQRCKDILFSDFRVGMLHGGLAQEEKEDVMRAFNQQQLDLLVATTVIEVGINVPTATIMMICESERFGVSQLHQLRGRVGRGRNASICFFHVGAQVTEEAMSRIAAIAATNDGFALAEIDLVHRQEGDILSTQQSGSSKRHKFLSIIHDSDIIERTRADAQTIVSADIELARQLVSDIDSYTQDFIDKT